MPQADQKLRIAIVMLICVAIVLYLFFYLSPASVPTLIVTTASSPTSQAAVGKLDDLPFPVRYSAVTSPEKLTPEQARKIFRFAQACQSPAQPIWYVEVHSNKMIDGNPDLFCSSTVFFRPEPTTSRLREFNQLYLYGVDALEKLLADPAPSKDASLPKPYQLIQVASADGKFYDDQATLPENAELFAKPEGLTDDDIIGLVDFIRSSPELHYPTTTTVSSDGQTKIVHYGPSKAEGDKRIAGIQKKEDGSVEIEILTKSEPSHSEGQRVICVKKEGKWVVQKICAFARGDN